MRRFGYAVVAVLALLAVAGCGAADERTRTDTICSALEVQAAQERGVERAQIDFLYSPVNPGDATAQIEVLEDTDPDVVAATVTEFIWKSELDPLRRIDVTVLGSATTTRVSYELPKDQAELQRLYGKRPALEDAQQFSTGILIGMAALCLLAVLLLIGVLVLVFRRMRRRRGARHAA